MCVLKCFIFIHSHSSNNPSTSIITTAKCRPTEEDHALDKELGALPDTHTSRFGEVCWAQGGVGYGWWPACIYNPSWAQGPARVEARRHLGKRHLVYFFNCDSMPFSVLNEAKIVRWTEGIGMDMHLGKASRAYGKERYEAFQQAMQAAAMEYDHPTFKHSKAKTPPSSPRKSPRRKRNSTQAVYEMDGPNQNVTRKKARRTSVFARTQDDGKNPSLGLRLSAKKTTAKTVATASESELICTIWEHLGESKSTQIGFVILPSQNNSTFADARKTISTEIDALSKVEWQFFAPSLGPISRAQERIFGAVWPFFSERKFADIGEGNAQSPLCLYIVKSE